MPLNSDPEKIRDPGGHFLTKEEILAKIAASRLALDRTETFLPHHGLYILRPKASKGDKIS
ncbi:MAG: hypothetical protein WBC70_14775 [Candidatus Aminicenantales bacterium]